MLLMMWVESSRCFPVRMPSAWMIRSVVSWKASRPSSCCIRRTRKLWRVFWGRWVSSMSSRRAWCQSRLNSSCSRASPPVKLNISLRRWTPRTVCTARLGRPLSAQYIGAKSSSSIRGSASFRKTSAQLPSRRLAFFGVTRNWDCQRLSCGSRARNMLPSLARALPQPPFPTLSSHCPRRTTGFYEGINIEVCRGAKPRRLSCASPDLKGESRGHRPRRLPLYLVGWGCVRPILPLVERDRSSAWSSHPELPRARTVACPDKSRANLQGWA